jgi:hypothetical protein
VAIIIIIGIVLLFIYVFFWVHFGHQVVENAQYVDFVAHPKTTSISASKDGNLYVYECSISLNEFLNYSKKEEWEISPIKDHPIIVRRYNWKEAIDHYSEFENYVSEHLAKNKNEICDRVIYHIVNNGFVYDNLNKQIDRKKTKIQSVYDINNGKLYVCYIKR